MRVSTSPLRKHFALRIQYFDPELILPSRSFSSGHLRRGCRLPACPDPRVTSSETRYQISKRALDVAVALLAAALLFPVILLTAVLVAADVGIPLIFRQARPGQGGQPIIVYKFRTMRPGVDGGRRLTEAQRTSRIGKFLRAFRLDELPQLYNVLKGDMSLVGPRPLLSEDQPDDAAVRLRVRPGITGWAQINGGRIISTAEKSNLDAWYVRNASLKLDFMILFQTLRMLLANNVDRVRANT